MDIRKLRYFESIVRNESFTVASEELHISQPSLSNAIKNLEKEIDCKLFARSTKRITLTESGQIIYQQACTVLNQFDNVIKEIDNVKHVGKGKINICMIESFRFWIPQIIFQFKDKYSDIHFKIQEMGPDHIINALNNFDIHIGITSLKKEHEELKYIPIFQETFVLITPLNHPLKNLKNVNIKDLKNEIFIHSLPGYEIREKVTDACHAAGFSPKGIYETESLETARSLVEIGLGVFVVPESYLKFHPLKRVNVVHLNEYIPKRTIYIVYHAARHLPASVHEFISHVLRFGFSQEIDVNTGYRE